MCGVANSEEVHHKVPVVLGGTDDNENYIALCDTCHRKEHRFNRSELTKAGLEKRKTKNVKDVLISKLDLLNDIHDIVAGGEHLSAADIVDMIRDAYAKKIILQ